MKRAFAVVVISAACLVVTSAQQPQPQPPLSERIAALRAKGGGNYFSGTDRPLSASVIGTFVSWQPGEIGLVVLWRGAERFYYASPRSGGGGGSADGYRHSSQFGSVRLDFTLNRSRQIARVNETEVSLADGQNVVLVDGADDTTRLSVRAIRTDLSSAGSPAGGSSLALAASDLAPIFRRSSELVSFFQCDTPANAMPARLTGYICEDLRAK
jgi:hypothetical protein